MTHALLNATTGIPLKYANRHGLITGQTGTGKTVTLQRLTEQFSKQGVPVFVSDVKGDIGALSRSCPVSFLDVFGQTGKPLSLSIHAMGADLMARALELTDTQAGCLEIAFAVARDKRLPLVTMGDLRAVLLAICGNEQVQARYGQVTKTSVSVIMRALLRLEQQGGNTFFANPQFDVAELLAPITTREVVASSMLSGDIDMITGFTGLVSILQAQTLINSPRVYAAFLMWLLTELWDRLPEVGDIEKPRLVLFFDESHLLFSEINPALLRKIEQTVRLIRSKGVGVYFVTQSPEDVPRLIREQLAFQVTHERAYRIGQAHVCGLNARGAPVNHGLIQVDLPDCPLGALSETEKPAVETPIAQPTGPQWARVRKPELVLLAIVLTLALAACGGLWWLWVGGGGGKILVVLAAVFVAGLLRS